MIQNGFPSNGMGMPAGGLASRRNGGQNIKPLSFDGMKSAETKDTGVPTPRTARGHLLAGLRTAPKSATAASFSNTSPTNTTASQMQGRNVSMGGNVYAQENGFAGPKTSMPRFSMRDQQAAVLGEAQYGNGWPEAPQQQPQPQQQSQQQQQNQHKQHFTAEQILSPGELCLEQAQDQMDPSLYAQLVATNMYLAQQQQRLQQQLLSVQAAAQQFQGMSLSGQSPYQQQMALQNLYNQQQQLRNLQQSMASAMPPQNLYSYYDPATGQQSYYVDQNASAYVDQVPSTPQEYGYQQSSGTPRVQVSPPPAENTPPAGFRNQSPPKKFEFTSEPEPLPPPSANAFRRGHKKSGSVAKSLSLANDESLASAGPRTGTFPSSPLPTGGYGPGQARAGEHPIRQPRGPPAIDELRSKPTSRHEGSKNFSARTRRSAVHNLVRAGLERRKGTGSSCGSMSPVSEVGEDLGTPLTDNESDSGRSGSGSLSGDAEPSLASSRTSTSGSWGAIGSDRPGSQQKSRKSYESLSSTPESDGSFAHVFKNGGQRLVNAGKPEGQRRAPRLVLTNAEKRRAGNVAA